MFFLVFAGSIRIFTLFLNLANSEIFLIPAIILLAIIFAFFTTPQPSAAPLTGSKKSKNQKISSLLGEGDHEVVERLFKKQWLKPFLKNLLRWIIANILAILVISWHLYHRNSEYFEQFIWIKNIEYTTPERKVFNDFVRISDTQKYHRYYV